MMASFLGPFQIAIYRTADANGSGPFDTDPPRVSFPVTFEQVFAALEAWPRMFIEPDGSFVWVGEEQLPDGNVTAWQLDGHLYDRDERLLYVELQGTCPRASFDRILAACAVQLDEILIEQRRAGTILRGKEFIPCAIE
jgi:hypothetical protein